MYFQTKAIVLSTIRHQEKGLVVKCFTQSFGLRSYFVRDAFSSKKGGQKYAYFRPLMLLDVICTNKNKGTLEYFKEVKLSYPYSSVNTNFVKTSIAFFVSEMLHLSIREEEKNQNFYNFLETSLIWLDNHDDVANFHLVLLLEITKFLGFYPDVKGKELPYFEMGEGVFSSHETITCLTVQKTNLLQRLLEIRFSSSEKAFHVTERQELLNILINYYSYHLEGFRKPKSLEVLKEIFM